jgi:glycosyltransferase involved in cell wall biosynthesis
MGHRATSDDTSTDQGLAETRDKNRPNLLFVSRKWSPAIGGMETYSVKLSEELSSFADVSVDALPGASDGSAPGMGSVLWFGLKAGFGIVRRAQRFDIIHIADMSSWPLAALARVRSRTARVVLSAHGTDVSFPDRPGFIPRVYGMYMRLGAKLVGHQTVIANSEATAGKARALGFRTVTVVPLATDMQPVERGTKTQGTGKKLLFAGRLVPAKGCRWFIEHVLPNLPDEVCLDVAGTVWDDGEKQALDADRVNFLGALSKDDLRQAYADADCVIIPNIDTNQGAFEGFGLVAVEAASSGALVLVSDHTGLKDAVIDGETGLSLPPGDAAAWTGAVLDVLGWSDEKRTSFVENAIRVAKDYYSWPRVANGTFKAYGWTS